MARGDPVFRNVDVDLESREPLGRLTDALPSLQIMYSTRIRGIHMLTLEGWGYLTLDQTLRRLSKLFSGLTGEPRRLWRRATKRSFNIGFECGTKGVPSFSIKPSTVGAVAAVGGSIEITLYPFEKPKPRKA